jgi:hypothetical protein
MFRWILMLRKLFTPPPPVQKASKPISFRTVVRTAEGSPYQADS